MDKPLFTETTFSPMPCAGATLRGLTRGFIFRLIKAGKVQSFKVPGANGKGGRRLVCLASLDAYIAAAEPQSGQ